MVRLCALADVARASHPAPDEVERSSPVVPGLVLPVVRLGLGCFAAALALYWLTAKPDLVGGDPGEFQFVLWVLGIPHHTGYPLYTLLGWAWAQLPVGNPAYRMNLFSGVWGAAAVGLAAMLVFRLSRSVAAALVAAAALTVAPLQWHWATIAGVRSGAVAEIGWLLLAGVAVVAAPTGRTLALLGLATGVALAHHRSGALALPGIAVALASVPGLWRLPVRAWLAAISLGVLPLLTYAYLPLRAREGPPFHQWHPETWDGFLGLVLAVEHSRVHFSFPLAAMPARAWLLWEHLRGEFGQTGLVLAAVGGLWLLAAWPRAWLLLAGYWAAQSWQVLNWDTGPETLNVVYQLPAHLAVAVFIGCGVAAVGWLVSMAGATRVRSAAVAVGAVIVLGWLGLRGWRELGAQAARAVKPINHDRSILADGHAARRIVGTGLARVEPNAIVVGDREQATVAWYLQLVEGVGQDVQVHYPVTNLPFTLRDHPDRPIWLMARTAAPVDRRLSADGPFVRVGAPERIATAAPPDARAIAARFEDALALVGIQTAADEVLAVTLYWRALGPARADLSVSVRLIAADGRIAAQQDNASPVLSLYPTSRWREGEVVGDYYELPYQSLAPGAYGLQVRVYQTGAGDFRDLRVGGADYAMVDAISRGRSAP